MQQPRKTVKQQIKTATVMLLNEKSYMDISVTDIVSRAGIARVSFYRNYNSIADVFDGITEDVYSEIVGEILPVLESNDETLWRRMLLGMFLRFPKHHSIGPGQRAENVNELFSRLLAKFQQSENTKSTQSIGEQYIGFGKMGLIVNIIKKWMADGQKESPEEMVDFMMTFITKF